ncbi:hypothetical protein HCN44_001255 [Aphidius gifuensis]|uniref:TMC domain-containing protein n=1 Tax=Aphidius gifuensis TaxID=684658 RepID=A0A835CLX1_APHGI|nr:hypothetical protein HCN44_001255 [Aphidius gifuensis]
MDSKLKRVIPSRENQDHQLQEVSGSMGILRIETNQRSRSRSFNNSLYQNQELNRPSVTFNLSDEYINNTDDKLTEDLKKSTGTMKKSQLSLKITTDNDNDNEGDKLNTIIDEPKSVDKNKSDDGGGGDDDDDEDDYSTSVSAMMQRKSSTRRSSKRKKRGSSTFNERMDSFSSHPRRRSSVFTTSSGDTAISMEQDDVDILNTKEQQVFEKLKLHKEVLGATKHQPWPLRKKIKLVKQAKSYVRKHEGALQERLAQSKSTKDILTQVSIYLTNKWKYFKREIVNLQILVIPWEVRIKEIESHFGSAVASYFVFLRWLFWINLVIAIILISLIVTPEIILTGDKKLTGDRKILLPNEITKSKNFLTLWEFEGIIKHSAFFYGWYTNWEPIKGGYRLPLAYFIVMLVVYVYSFVAILRKMAKNSRMSKLSEKEDECAFSWKLFTGWDFMIGNSETAHNKIASIVLGFKESLLEEAEKEKKLGQWKIRTVRVLVNLTVILLLAFSVWAVVKIVNNSAEFEAETNNWWKQNAITIVLSLISYIFPIFFEILGIFENYHPRKTLRLQLGRIMILNLLNLYSLIFALFGKIHDMEEELQSLKPKLSSKNLFTMKYFNSSNCRNILIYCSELINYKSHVNANYTTALPSTTTKKNLITTITTLALVTLPTSLTTTNQNNYIESRINDAPDELQMGLDSFNSFESSSIFNYSETIPVSLLTPSIPRFDDRITWEGYSENDEQNFNYDNYDTENITYGNDDESSTTIDNDTMTNFTDNYWITEPSFSTLIEELNDDNDDVSMETTTKPTQKVESIKKKQKKNTSVIKKDNKNSTKCLITVCDVCHDSSKKYSKAGNKFLLFIYLFILLNILFFILVSLSAIKRLNMTTRRNLRRLCWETMFGQELAKLTVMDLMLTIVATLGMDFFRALFVRYTNSWWCFDLEKQFPQYGDFKIAENILHLVNNQGMVWMGMFFSPGLTLLNVIKLGILMYLRSWAVLTCNVPHEIIFRASRSNNFYLALLLTMLFLCVIPVGYALTWIEPSWHCGPFSGYHRIYHIATESLKDALPEKIRRSLDYIASPGIVIPLIVLMALIIYYMVSLAGSLREANNDLKIQLRHERTEERRKMFKIASKRGQSVDTPFLKWKKIISTSPTSASIEISKNVGNVLQERRQRAIERLNSTSEVDPSLLQAPEPPSLSPVIQDDGQIFFGNTEDTKT